MDQRAQAPIEFRMATAADADALADAHRDSIRTLGSLSYAQPVVDAWAAARIEAALGAVDFYRTHGFVETGRGDVELPSGVRMPCVFMRKPLFQQTP